MTKIKFPVSKMPEFLELCNKLSISVNDGTVLGDDYGSISYTCFIESKFITNLFLSKIGEFISISNDKVVIPFH